MQPFQEREGVIGKTMIIECYQREPKVDAKVVGNHEDSQPGKPIPKITTARLDSMLGFVFTSLNLAGPGVLQAAFKNHRKVQITYTPNGQNTGKIISASYTWP